MHRITREIALFACLLGGLVTHSLAQVKIVATGEIPGAEKLSSKTFSSRPIAVEQIQKLGNEYLLMGYLEYRLDTAFSGATYTVKAQPGRRYSWDFRLPQNSELRYDRNFYKKLHTVGSYKIVESQIENWLREHEDKGYPFCQVKMNEVTMNDSMVTGEIQLEPGPFMEFDSLVIKSNDKISHHYIRNYIGFRKGDAYNESWLRGIKTRMNEVPFCRQVSDPGVVFKPGSALVYLYLEKKRANYFNGILGIQPNEQTGKVNLTGDLEIKLVNALNDGEEFYLNWRKLQSQTQDLSVKTTVPYLFDLPLGVGGSLKIYRRDSTFSAVNSSFFLIHFFTGSDYIKAFIEGVQSNRISSFQPVSNLANVRSVLYGLGIKREHLDYRYNPRKGTAILLEGATGNKTIGGTPGENGTPDRNTANYRLTGLAEWYVPTFRQQAIRMAVQGGGILSGEVYENEMFRLGGLRTLRGLDEESINASSFIVSTVEYRLLLEQNSNIYLFADQGWYENKNPTQFVTDTPLGLGAGVNFETGAGIFTVNYALGSQFDNPLLFRTAKISFGFRNLF